MTHGLTKQGPEPMDLNKTSVITTKATGEASHVESLEVPDAHAEIRMTKAKWLACIALSLSYTTAFQQNACTAAIVKHIDAELGKHILKYFGLFC